MNDLVNFGVPIILFLQSLGDGFLTIMGYFTLMGNVEFFLAVLPAVYWCWETALGARVGIMLMFSATVNEYFKWIFRTPRPYWINDEVNPGISEHSFGLPSGHAQNAVANWGIIAAGIKRRWVWIVAIALIFLIGVSRLALGVHSLIDVLAGWTIGGILLWGFIKLEPPVMVWFNRKTHLQKIGILFGISMLSILIGLVILLPLQNFQVPDLWLENTSRAFPEDDAINPAAPSNLILRAAVFFGLTAGIVWMEARGQFEVGGAWWKRLLRYPIGLIGTLLIWQGLDMVFPEGETLVAYLFYYLRYGLVGLWISAGAPLSFMRLGLAEPAQKQETLN